MKETITIYMPISRLEYLPSVFARLEIMHCDASRVNLLTIVDGDNALYIEARNLTQKSKFNQRLCVQYKPDDKKNKFRHFDPATRRKRISEINNVAHDNMPKCDYVMGLEDDTLISDITLEKFISDYHFYPNAGFIEGVQLGRWGISYVGAWNVDDIYDPAKIVSQMPSKDLRQIDTGGFYCYITRYENFMSHHHKPYDVNSLGPDFYYGIELRRQGMLNYIDWNIQTTHRTNGKDITLQNTEPERVTLLKEVNKWRQVREI